MVTMFVYLPMANQGIFYYFRSGKTYTMEGSLESDDFKGIIPHSIDNIFSMIQSEFYRNYNYKISVSF